MGALKDARTAIADLVAGVGVKAYPYLPGRVTPPVAVVQAGSPYIESGIAFGHFHIRHEIIVVSSTAANDVATDALDNSVEDIIVALANANYSIENASQPYALEANNATYPAVEITVTSEISL